MPKVYVTYEDVGVPWAVDSEKEPIHVAAAEKGIRYGCIGCLGELIPHRGNTKNWHFAHFTTTDPELTCNPETRLHLMTKRLVLKALETPPVIIILVCPQFHTKAIIIGDINDPIDFITTEAVQFGVKPDIYIETVARRRIAIEIIVSHYPTTKALTQYRNLHIETYGIQPERQWLDDSEKDWHSVRAFMPLGYRCEDCADLILHSRRTHKSMHGPLATYCYRHDLPFDEFDPFHHVWGGYWCFPDGTMEMMMGPNGIARLRE